MKTKLHSILAMAILLLVNFPATAQGIYSWSACIPATDSISFNSNPSGYLIDHELFAIFYEKRTCDTCKPQIWFRNLSTLEPEKQMISGSFSYTNPIFYTDNSNLHKGYLIYLSDSLGNTDIYATLVDNAFNIGTTTQLTFTTDDEHGLVSSSEYNIQNIGWIIDSCAILSTPNVTNESISLTNPAKIDSLSVTDFECKDNIAYLQRKEGDSLHLFGRNLEYDQTSGWYWGDIYPIATTGNNTELSTDKVWLYGEGEDLYWVKDNHIFGFDRFGSDYQFETYDLPDIHHPGCVSMDIVTKDPVMPHILVYSSGNGVNSEIYSSFGEYTPYVADTSNLTKNQIPDNNPYLFWGEEYGYNSSLVYVVWQSHRNGHVPLYFSTTIAYLEGVINETNFVTISMSASPNPFNQQLDITLSSTKNSEVSLTIYSLTGQVVWQKTLQSTGQEKYAITWKPDPKLPKGIYLILAEQSGVKVSQKIVYQ